jgi:hypothetical protein
MALISSAAFWANALLITGLIGTVWFLWAADSPASGIPLAAVLALTASVGITGQQSRARARKRLQRVLDAYAERELALSGRQSEEPRTAAVASRTLPRRDR